MNIVYNMLLHVSFKIKVNILFTGSKVNTDLYKVDMKIAHIYILFSMVPLLLCSSIRIFKVHY